MFSRDRQTSNLDIPLTDGTSNVARAANFAFTYSDPLANVTCALPTSGDHAATKGYVDSQVLRGQRLSSNPINYLDVTNLYSLYGAGTAASPFEIQTLQAGFDGQVIHVANLRQNGATITIKHEYSPRPQFGEKYIISPTNADDVLPSQSSGFLTYNALFAGGIWYFTVSGASSSLFTNMTNNLGDRLTTLESRVDMLTS